MSTATKDPWKIAKPQPTFTAVCSTCGKSHQIDKDTFQCFGRDTICLKCTNNNHIDFMRTIGRKLGLSCVKGCRCGAGS